MIELCSEYLSSDLFIYLVTYLVKIVNDRSEHNFVCNFHKPPSANQKQQKPSQEPRKFVRWRALKQ